MPTEVQQVLDVGELCRQIYRVVIDPEQDIGNAFVHKRTLHNYYFMSGGEVSGCLAGVARRVCQDAAALHKVGDHTMANAIMHRLGLVSA